MGGNAEDLRLAKMAVQGNTVETHGHNAHLNIYSYGLIEIKPLNCHDNQLKSVVCTRFTSLEKQFCNFC